MSTAMSAAVSAAMPTAVSAATFIVRGNVHGDARGIIDDNIRGHVRGDVQGDIRGTDHGHVCGKVRGSVSANVHQRTAKHGEMYMIEEMMFRQPSVGRSRLRTYLLFCYGCLDPYMDGGTQIVVDVQSLRRSKVNISMSMRGNATYGEIKFVSSRRRTAFNIYFGTLTTLQDN